MAEQQYLRAVNEAHHEALAADDDVFVMGEDVTKGVTGTTVGLADEFDPARVRDTPISEEAFTGLGVGAALQGKRPIVEYQINTLVHVGWDQLVNHAAKLRYMSGGQVSVPLTVTVPMSGVPGGSAGQHSDSTWPPLAHFGIKNAIPSTPADAKGLFRSAVEEDDPVVVHFPPQLHGRTGEVPDGPHSVPLGEAVVREPGEDVTIIAVGETVPMAEAVATELAPETSVEVIDLRTPHPLDESTILESIEKTGRVVIADNALRFCGMAAEVAARISNVGFWTLDAPIKRVTRAETPASYAPSEENAVIVDEDLIREAVTDIA